MGINERVKQRKESFQTAGEDTERHIWKDFCVTAGLLAGATAVSYLFFKLAPESMANNVAMIYILAMVLIGRLTNGYAWGIAASMIGVICVNFLYTYPFMQLNFTMAGYPLSFVLMLAISMMTGTMTVHMRKQAQILADREKLLMEAEKEKMRANLLRAVSHDLRTPLTGIIGASSFYLENGDNLPEEEQRELVHHIQDDAHWLLNMVENLLSVTRINAKTTKVNKALESVEEVVAEAVTRLKKRLPEAEIQVTVPEEMQMIMMDAMLIEQVIINLLENAVIHAKGSRPVELHVVTELDVVAFHVRDYGIGIAEDRLATIFDGGSYVEQDKGDSMRGMGIGLSICKTIVSSHGGEIGALNHSEGAEFYFTLPREEE